MYSLLIINYVFTFSGDPYNLDKITKYIKCVYQSEIYQ